MLLNSSFASSTLIDGQPDARNALFPCHFVDKTGLGSCDLDVPLIFVYHIQHGARAADEAALLMTI